MRLAIAVISLFVSLSVSSQEPSSVEILGVDVSRGMSKEELSRLLPPESITVVPKGPSAEEEIDFWHVSAADENGERTSSGMIMFENDRVRRATKTWGNSNHAEAYELLVTVNMLLDELIAGSEGCAIVKTRGPMGLFDQRETLIVLPEKTISISTGSRGGEFSVGISETLHAQSPNDDRGCTFQ